MLGRLIGVFLLVPVMAQAAVITIGFEGVITANDPTQPPELSQFDDRFAVGNRVYGSYEIRDGLQDFRPDDPDFGFYLSPLVFFIEDAAYGISAFQTNSGSLRVINDLTNIQTGLPYDLYDLGDFASSGLGGSTQDGANPLAPNSFRITLTDLDASVLDSGALPLSVPDIVDDYDEAEFAVFFGAGQLNGTITSLFQITDHTGAIPEPVTVSLFAVGLASLGFLRRGRGAQR